MNKKKKSIIISCLAIIALAAVILAVVLIFTKNDKEDLQSQLDYETVTIEDVEPVTKNYGKDEFDIKEDENGKQELIKGDELQKPNIDIKKPSDNAQLGITLDNTLRIDSIAELDGRFCVIVENISKRDIQSAALTFAVGNQKTHCKIVALMSGQRAILFCENNIKYNKDEYYVNWELLNPVFYQEKPQMHEDRFEISINGDEITLKNKSLLRAKGPIYIVMQRVSDGMNICSEARRVKLDTIGMQKEATVRVPGFNTTDYKVVFIDYDN